MATLTFANQTISENHIEMWVACVLIVLIFLLIKFTLWRQKYMQMPGTKPSFFNVFRDFDISRDLQPQLLDFMKRKAELFQKQKIFCVWITYIPFVVINKTDAVKEALKSHKMIDKSWQYEYMELLFGNGLFLSKGQKWKFRRKLLTPCFHSDMLRSFLPIFNEKSHDLVNALRDETTKDFTKIIDFTTSCAMDIMCETILGVTPEEFRKGKLQYVQSVKWLSNIFMERILNAWKMPLFIFSKTKLGREAMRHMNEVKQIIRTVIADKKSQYLNRDRSSQRGNGKALMDLLLEHHFEIGDLDTEGVNEEVDTFAVAAHITVANACMWALYLIGLYPEVQFKIHEELDKTFGPNSERIVTEKDLLDLQYLGCVLKECSRLYPTIPIFLRKPTEDIKICGYTIPKGATCVVSTFFLHRDKDVFPDPEKFDPDRFSTENIANIPECAYIPFSVGPRLCIGYKYAEIELKIMISSVLRNFTVKSLDPRHKILPIMNVTLDSSTPVRIRIRSRFLHKS